MIDPTTLLKRAWHLAWNHRFLWVLGLLSGGGGGVNITIPPTGPSGSRGSSGDEVLGLPQLPHLDPALLVTIVVAVLVLALVFVVLGVLARGGIVHCTLRLDAGQPTGLGDGFSAGAASFWRVLGVEMLMGGGLLAFVLVAALLIVPMAWWGGMGGLVAAICVGLVALLLFFVVAVVVSILHEYAVRGIVASNLGALDSVRSAWALANAHRGTTLLVWAIALGVGMGGGLAGLIGALVLAIPFVVVGFSHLMWGLVPGVIVLLAWFLVAGGLVNSLVSAFWTLAFTALHSGDTCRNSLSPVPVSLMDLPPDLGSRFLVGRPEGSATQDPPSDPAKMGP